MSDETKKKLSKAHKGKPSPRKGKKLTNETKKKISEANKGNRAWNKGKTPSEETRKKISESTKKQMKSAEIRKKISKTWFKKGEPSLRKGKKLTNETKKKISEANKGKLVGDKHPMKGKKHSEKSINQMKESHKNITDETKKKISEANKGRISPFKGVTDRYSEETIRKISEARNKQKFPSKDSKPELLTQSILKKHSISFKKHHSFKLSNSHHQADILIEPNHVIEVFGDYWHFNPKKYDGESNQKKGGKDIEPKDVWKYDKYVIDGMKEQGYKVLVVWESELKDELEKTTKKILRFIKT